MKDASQNHNHTEKNNDDNSNAEPIKVMLADDDEDDTHLFEEALNNTPLHTEFSTVGNGEELMDNLHDPSIPNPDIIFLDINMPKKDGKECLKEIKSDDELKDIPCIMYSTSNNEKDINETFSSGANLYVSKPNSFNKIVSVLTLILTLKWNKLYTRPVKKEYVLSDKH